MVSAGGGSSLRAWLSNPRAEYARWSRPRPVLGGLLLILGGLIIGYVPIQFTSELMLIGGGFTILGLIFAILVVFCGLATLSKPRLSSIFGVLGIALSTLSIFGALGGLFLGTIVGTIGGILCYAWEPPEGFDETTLAEASEFIWQETGGFIWQDSGGFIWNRDPATDTSDAGDGPGSEESFEFPEESGDDEVAADDEDPDLPFTDALDPGEEESGDDEDVEVDDDLDDRFKL